MKRTDLLPRDPSSPLCLNAVNVPAGRVAPPQLVSIFVQVDKHPSLSRGGQLALGAHFNHIAIEAEPVPGHVVMQLVGINDRLQQAPKLLERRLRPALCPQLLQANLERNLLPYVLACQLVKSSFEWLGELKILAIKC